jgi:hypothetical protein
MSGIRDGKITHPGSGINAHIRNQQFSTEYARIIFLCMSTGPISHEDVPPDTSEIFAAFALIPFLCMPNCPLGSYGTNIRHQLTEFCSGIHACELSRNSSSYLVSFLHIFFLNMGLLGPAIFSGIFFMLVCLQAKWVSWKRWTTMNPRTALPSSSRSTPARPPPSRPSSACSRAQPPATITSTPRSNLTARSRRSTRFPSR